jgi:hypothetical protein
VWTSAGAPASGGQDPLQDTGLQALDGPREPFEPRPVACTIFHRAPPRSRAQQEDGVDGPGRGFGTQISGSIGRAVKNSPR